MPEKIIQADLLEEYKKDSIRYSILVNRIRAIVDARDGLKTIHRRITDVMYHDVRCISNHVKSSHVVGTTMAKSHPHGDTSTYQAMKPMANYFEINYPLIDGQGNWGNYQGDNAAAARYTEAKLSQYALDCIIGELQETKQVVDWRETYDYRNMEPEYMPVRVPNLLINGAFGIGFGLKCDIPKHNLVEVINATIKLIKDPEAQIELIPDHPLGAHIINTNFKSIGNKGRGAYIARGNIDIETDKNGRVKLVITSLPDMVNLNSIAEAIDTLVLNKTIQVQEINEESNGDNIRFVIELKKGANPEFTREIIYKSTQMEKKFTVNFEVLDGYNPVRMSYKAYLLRFIDFRKVTKFRLYCNRLQDVETKFHEKEAYIKVLQSNQIEKIISMIRGQSTIDDSYLIEFLIKELKITDLQAKFIISANIKNLSIGYLNKYIEEAAKLSALRDEFMNKILNEDILIDEIIAELEYFKQKYGRPRRSKVISASEASEVPKGDFKLAITKNNFIKKVPVNMSLGNFREDIPKMIVKGCNSESLLLFSASGKVHRLPIHQIATSDKNGSGQDIRLLIKSFTSDIVAVIYEPKLEELSKKTSKYYVVVLTEDGSIKRMDLEDFLNVPKSGNLFIKLDSNVLDVAIAHSSVDVIVYTIDKAVRMRMDDIPLQKRNTKGQRAISLKDNELVHGMSFVSSHSNMDTVLVVTEKGRINRIDSVAVPITGRNKPGISVIKLSKGDTIYSIISCSSSQTLHVKTKLSPEEILIKVDDIPKGSSVSQGEKVIPLKNDNILSVRIS